MAVNKKWTEKSAEKLAKEIDADYKVFASAKEGALPLDQITFKCINSKGERLYRLKHMCGYYLTVHKGHVRSVMEEKSI